MQTRPRDKTKRSMLSTLYGLTQFPYIAQGRVAEEAAVFSAKLGRTLITHFKGRAGCIEPFGQHQASGLPKPELFLELKRAQGGHGAEMMVKRGCAHAGLFGQVFDAKGLGVMAFHPINGLSDLMALTACGGDLP